MTTREASRSVDSLSIDHLEVAAPTFSRSPSPTSSIQALYVRSRPTSTDFSLDGLSTDESNGGRCWGLSIEAALKSFENNKISSATVLADTFPDNPLGKQADTDNVTTIIYPDAFTGSGRFPRYRTVRLTDCLVDKMSIDDDNLAHATSASPKELSKHQRSRTWSVRRLGLLLSRKGDIELLDANKFHQKRRLSISQRFGFSRRVSAKGIEHIEDSQRGATLNRTRSLVTLHPNQSLINRLEAEGIDEATADAIRCAAKMHEEYDFEQLHSEDEWTGLEESGSKSLFNMR